jgi:hypothetical protein
MKKIKRDSIISFLALCALFTSCASAQKESISVEKKKGGVTIVHHRAKTSYGARDRIEAINAKGVVTQAEVKVYDVGRMPDGHGGMREASRYYRIVKSSTFDLRLPAKSGNTASGPKTVFTPPNYSPPPYDQRVDDAVESARQAKAKLDEQQRILAAQIDKDNVLRGQLETQISANQLLADQLKAAFNTQKAAKLAPETDAQKAADGATDSLENWGKQVGNP